MMLFDKVLEEPDQKKTELRMLKLNTYRYNINFPFTCTGTY